MKVTYNLNDACHVVPGMMSSNEDKRGFENFLFMNIFWLLTLHANFYFL